MRSHLVPWKHRRSPGGRRWVASSLAAVLMVAATGALSLTAAAPAGAEDATTWPWLNGLRATDARNTWANGWDMRYLADGVTPTSPFSPPMYATNNVTKLNWWAMTDSSGCQSSTLDVSESPALPTENRARIGLVGDSIASESLWSNGGGPLSKDPRYRWIEATKCGQSLTSDGSTLDPAVTSALRSAPFANLQALVVALGTNDITSFGGALNPAAAVANLKAAVAARPCVVLVNLTASYQDPAHEQRATAFNTALANWWASDQSRVKWVDFNTAGRTHPEFLTEDSLGNANHTSPVGTDARTNMIRDALRGCPAAAAAGPNNGIPTPFAPTNVTIGYNPATPSVPASATVRWTPPTWSGTPPYYRVRTYATTPDTADPTGIPSTFGVSRLVAAQGPVTQTQQAVIPLGDLGPVGPLRATVEAVNESGVSVTAESTLDADPTEPGPLPVPSTPLQPGGTVTRGRDGGNSVRLADGRTFWIFGDFGATVQNGVEVPYGVRNTATITAPNAPLTLASNGTDPLSHSGTAAVEFIDPPLNPTATCPSGAGPTHVVTWPAAAAAVPNGAKQNIYVWYTNLCADDSAPPDSPRFFPGLGSIGVGVYTYDPAHPPTTSAEFHLQRLTDSLFPRNRFPWAASDPNAAIHPAVPGMANGLVDALTDAAGNVELYTCNSGSVALAYPMDALGCHAARVNTTSTLTVADPAAYTWFNDLTQSWGSSSNSSTLRLPDAAPSVANRPWYGAPLTDVSVRYFPNIGAGPAGRYVMAYLPWNGQGNTVVLRQAKSPQGPWSPPAVLPIANCPGCYEFQLHPEGGRPGEIVLTASVRGSNPGAMVTITVPAAAPTPGTGYHAITPTRLLDSRVPVASGGAWGSPLVAGSPLTLTVGGTGGVPSTATAVVLNVTATNPSAGTFVNVYPAGTGEPTGSVVNVPPGATRANLATVPVGTNGLIVFTNAVGTTELVADVVGYYDNGTPAGDLYTGITPIRLLDSRGPTGGWNGPLTAGTPRDLTVRRPDNPNGVPSAATAVIANVTVTGATAGSFVTVWSSGVTQPTVSNLNFGAGQTLANLAVIPIGANGSIRVANAVGSVQVIVDVVGYYQPGAGSRYHSLDSRPRIFDSRVAATGGVTGPWGPGERRVVPVTGTNGIPAGASGLVMNTTVTDATAGSLLTIWPDGATQPTSSTINFGPNDTVGNLTVVGLPTNGAIDIYNQLGTVNVIGDVAGYYAST